MSIPPITLIFNSFNLEIILKLDLLLLKLSRTRISILRLIPMLFPVVSGLSKMEPLFVRERK